MPKFSAYMRGEGTKGDTGEVGIVSATTHPSEVPTVTVTTSGSEYRKNIDFDFGLVRGEAAGFSTNQNSNIEFISVTSNPSVSITTDNTSPNNSKVFNFDFKIPEPLGISEITAVTTTTSEGINEITIWYNNGTTTSFNISNGAQGEAALVKGIYNSYSDLPQQNNYIGEAYLVGGENQDKELYVYTQQGWTNQGGINYAHFGNLTASATLVSSTTPPEVTITTSGLNTSKNFDFNFKIPQGEKGDKGDTPIIELSTSVTSLPQNTDPTLSLTTLGENNFRFDFGLPKGFVQEMTATATANDLEPGSDASATVIVNQNNLNFTFGIPQGIIGKNGIGVSTVEFEGQSLTTGGNIYTINFAEPDSDTIAFSTRFEAPQGPEGIGFYQKLEFTSTSTNIWIDGENGTSTLIIDRTAKEIIPINIYNSTSNNIAATFTLADPTVQYPHGSIQYNTNEKFDGTLYYIGESPTPQVEVGSVTTVAGTTASVIASKNGHNTVLDFVFPTKGDKGDTGTSIASVTYDHEADNKTYYKMLFTDSTSTLFAVDKGDKGDTGEQGVKGDTGEAAGFGTPTISVNSLAEGQTPTAQITATGDDTSKIFSFTFGIPKGDKGDQGIQGIKGDQGNGVTNISAPVVDGLTKTYTITYGNNDNTTSFTVEDGLAATISFSSGVIIDNTIQQPTTIIEGTSTNPLVTFKFPDSYGSDLKYTASTADFPENGSLTTGYFYFQYEEE